MSTQVRFPARAVARTIVQNALPTLLIVPIVINLISEGLGVYLPAQAVAALAVSSAFITALAGVLAKVMAIPQIDAWLDKWKLSSAPAQKDETPVETPAESLTHTYNPNHD